MASPAQAVITSPAVDSPVSGIVSVTESEYPPTVTPSTTKCTSSTRNRTGQVNLTVYKGATSGGPIYRATQSVVVANPPAPVAPFLWNTHRLPNGVYNLRSSINDRTVPATPTTNANCALGTTQVKSDPHNVSLANPGVIDMISGVGSSGTTATVTARLQDGSITPTAPYVTNSADPIQIQRTKGFTFFGTNFTVGNGGTPAGSTVDGFTFTNAVAPTTFPVQGNAGFTLYTDTVEGYAPGIADGQTVSRFNRLTVTTTDGPQTVECLGVFQKTTSALTGATQFSGFRDCFSAGTGEMIAPQQQPDGSYTGGSTVVEGHAPATLTFTIGGVTSDPVPVDRLTGLATGTVNTPDVPPGKDVPVTVQSSDDGFLTPATAIGAIDFKGGSVTTYTGDTDAFWDEDFTASATVVGAVGGLPINDGTVTFTRGTQVSEPIPLVNGVATTTMHAEDPGAAGQTITAVFSGTEELYNPSEDSPLFLTKPRPTEVDYTGPTFANNGDQVTLSAKLTDVRDNNSPLAGQTIAFKLGDNDALTAVTGADGVASETVDVSSEVGPYPLTATFFEVPTYAGDVDSTMFSVGFQYEFTDDLIGNHGTTRLNPDTQQVGYRRANGQQSRVADNSYQLSIYLPTVVGYPSTDPGALPTLPDEWNILNLPRLTDLFFLLANPPALPGVPTITPPAVPDPTAPPEVPPLPLGELPIAIPMSTSSSSASAATPRAGLFPTVPADGGGLPLPTEGMTLGEFIERVTTAGLPTSLNVCELISGSTCERRFIVAAAVLNGGPNVVGVFDVKTGLFASLVQNAPGASPLPVLGASLGSCATPQPLCIALPGLPSGGPGAPTPPDIGDPSGLQAAIEALLAGLQGLPGGIEAPPAPPVTPPEVPAAPMSSTATPSPVAVPVALPTTSLLPGQGLSLATLIPTYWLG